MDLDKRLQAACLRLAVGFALVLEATHRLQVSLVVAEPVCVAVVVAHAPGVGDVAEVFALIGTPPEAIVADMTENVRTVIPPT